MLPLPMTIVRPPPPRHISMAARSIRSQNVSCLAVVQRSLKT